MTHHIERLQALCAEHQLGKSGRPVAIIGESMIIHGSATARDDADVLVLGQVHGSLEARGAIVIDKGARVLGNVKASRLCVLGEIDAAAADAGVADIQLDGLLDVRSSGIVRAATINYAQLRTESGGRISGQMRYCEQASTALQDSPEAQSQEAPEQPTSEFAAAARTAAVATQSTGEDDERAAARADRAPRNRMEPGELAPLVQLLPSLDGGFRSPAFQRERGG